MGTQSKSTRYCEHCRATYYCVPCRGKGICEHDARRNKCKECKSNVTMQTQNATEEIISAVEETGEEVAEEMAEETVEETAEETFSMGPLEEQ
eukprot:757044-Rhodomonas_salina.2